MSITITLGEILSGLSYIVIFVGILAAIISFDKRIKKCENLINGLINIKMAASSTKKEN